MNKELKDNLKDQINNIADSLKNIINVLNEDDEDWDEDSDTYFWDDLILKDTNKIVEVPEPFNLPEPFTISKKLINDFISPRILLNDSWLYVYGYDNDSPIERTLCISKMVHGAAMSKVINFGYATRFEIVYNNDLFYYCSGSIGTSMHHTMRIANPYLVKDGDFVLTHFTIEE